MRLPLVIPSEESASGGDESRNGTEYRTIHLEGATSDPSETRNTSGESRDLVFNNRISRLVRRYTPFDKLRAVTHSLEINIVWIARHSSTPLHFARNDNATIVNQYKVFNGRRKAKDGAGRFYSPSGIRKQVAIFGRLYRKIRSK